MSKRASTVDLSSLSEKFSNAIKAATKGELAPIQIFLGSKGDVDHTDKFGSTMLMQASYRGHFLIVKYLVEEKNAKINLKDKDGKNALYHACFHGHEKVAGFLVGRASEVTIGCLMKAAAKGIVIVVQYWINMGMNTETLDIEDADEVRVLMHASAGGHIEVVRFLVENSRCSADIEACDSQGKSALTYACQNNANEVAEYLLFKGASVTYFTARKAATKGMMSVLQNFVLKNPTSINQTDQQGWTLLMDAAFHGQNDIAEYLISKGANLDLKAKGGQTALYWACFKRHTDTAQLLIKAGAEICLINLVSMTDSKDLVEVTQAYANAGGDVHAVDQQGRSLLSWACCEGNLDLIHWLVSVKNANINQTDFEGRTPLFWAQFSKKWDVVEFLVRLSQDDLREVVMVATENGVPGVIQAYANKGGDLNVIDASRRTFLMKAAQSGQLELIATLVELGGKLLFLDDKGKTALSYLPKALPAIDIVRHFRPNFEDIQGNTIAHAAANDGNLSLIEALSNTGAACLRKANAQGVSPLDLAIRYCHVEVVEHLLIFEDAMNLWNDNGEMPLHQCCRWGHLSILKVMLTKISNSSDVSRLLNEKTKNEGNTSLMVACKWGWLQIVEYLIESKMVDLSATNTAGQTMLHIAAERNQVDIVMYLLRIPQIKVEAKDVLGNSAADACVLNGIVGSIPLLFQRAQNKMPEDVLNPFQLTKKFCRKHDPHAQIFSYEYLYVISVSNFTRQSHILGFDELQEKKLLQSGLQVLNDSSRVLYISAGFCCGCPTRQRVEPIKNFLHFMKTELHTEFDFIYYPYGCISQQGDETSMMCMKMLPLAFLQSCHFFFCAELVEDQKGNLMTDLECLCSEGMSSTELLVAMLTGKPVYTKFRFNEDSVFSLVDTKAKNPLFSTAEQVIRSWTHLSNRSCKSVWKNWCRAKDVTQLLRASAAALKACSSVDLAKVFAMVDLNKTFTQDQQFLAACYSMGNFQSQQCRVVLCRALFCLIIFFLDLKVYDGQRRSSSYNEDEDLNTPGTGLNASSSLQIEIKNSASIGRSIQSALQHRRSSTISFMTARNFDSDTNADGDLPTLARQGADGTVHLQVKLAYTEKQMAQLQSEFKKKLTDSESKQTELAASLKKEKKKVQELLQEIERMKEEQTQREGGQTKRALTFRLSSPKDILEPCLMVDCLPFPEELKRSQTSPHLSPKLGKQLSSPVARQQMPNVSDWMTPQAFDRKLNAGTTGGSASGKELDSLASPVARQQMPNVSNSMMKPQALDRKLNASNTGGSASALPSIIEDVSSMHSRARDKIEDIQALMNAAEKQVTYMKENAHHTSLGGVNNGPRARVHSAAAVVQPVRSASAANPFQLAHSNLLSEKKKSKSLYIPTA